MPTRIKRTYNLSDGAVTTVRQLVEERSAAPTQDALVEQAIADMARHVRDADDAALWERAARDSAFGSETAEIDQEFADDDQAAWDGDEIFPH